MILFLLMSDLFYFGLREMPEYAGGGHSQLFKTTKVLHYCSGGGGASTGRGGLPYFIRRGSAGIFSSGYRSCYLLLQEM